MPTGVARKIGMIAAGVTGLGWLLVVIGFGIATAPNLAVNFGNPLAGSQYFPHWIISLGGIPLIALAVAHAVASRAKIFKILGTITTFFSILFLMSLGMMLYIYGLIIVRSNTRGSTGTLNTSVYIMFAGSLLASLSCTLLMMLWPFYKMDETNQQVERSRAI